MKTVDPGGSTGSGASILVPPLTRANGKGVLLERTEEVTAQITRALGAEAAELRKMLSELDYTAAQYLGPECLVFLIRHFRARVDNDIVEALAAALLKRCGKRIRRKLSALEDPDTRKDAVSDVIDQLFRKILDLEADTGDFLQVRFWWMLDKYIVKAFNRAVKREKRQAQAVRLAALAGEDPDGDEDDGFIARSAGEPLCNARDSPDWGVVLGEALQALKSMDRRYADAFVLRHAYGWPIEAADEDTPSISRHFGKDPRTIHNWLTRAEDALARWRKRAL